MRIPWFSRKKKRDQDETELARAQREAAELERRSKRLLRDNHFVADVKKVLGA